MHALDPGKARLAQLVITANKTWKSPSSLKQQPLTASPELQTENPSPSILSIPQRLLGVFFLFLRTFCCGENGGGIAPGAKTRGCPQLPLILLIMNSLTLGADLASGHGSSQKRGCHCYQLFHL